MSNDEIAQRIVTKVELHILAYLPHPECVEKKHKWKWDIEQVKKKVAESLYSPGINIKIEA